MKGVNVPLPLPPLNPHPPSGMTAIFLKCEMCEIYLMLIDPAARPSQEQMKMYEIKQINSACWVSDGLMGAWVAVTMF